MNIQLAGAQVHHTVRNVQDVWVSVQFALEAVHVHLTSEHLQGAVHVLRVVVVAEHLLLAFEPGDELLICHHLCPRQLLPQTFVQSAINCGELLHHDQAHPALVHEFEDPPVPDIPASVRVYDPAGFEAPGESKSVLPAFVLQPTNLLRRMLRSVINQSRLSKTGEQHGGHVPRTCLRHEYIFAKIRLPPLSPWNAQWSTNDFESFGYTLLSCMPSTGATVAPIIRSLTVSSPITARGEWARHSEEWQMYSRRVPASTTEKLLAPL